MVKSQRIINRKEFLQAGAVVGGAALFGLLSGAYKFQIGQGIVAAASAAGSPRNHLTLPTPACADHDATPLVSEGPFYAPATPLQADFRPKHHAGKELRLAGRVLDTACRPLSGAILDFWQTDPAGLYDHFGYDYRGHQVTDADGRYELLTLLPASYKFMGVWRRRHIHVKIKAQGYRFLTSQVFFPFGADSAVEDFSFDRRLVSRVKDMGAPFVDARFDFVLEQS